jgi:nucleoside-diphosphate-sugar epimerase
MKIAITGAQGFIAEHLMRELDKLGIEYVGLSRSDSVGRSSKKIIRVDYMNRQELSSALNGVTAVIHLAGTAHANLKNADDIYRQSIFEVTKSLISASIASNVKRFVNVSTIKVYGETSGDLTFHENSPCNPQSAYAKYKLEAEKYVREAVAGGGIKAFNFRFPPVYGPGMKGSIKFFFYAANKKLPLPFARLKFLRTFLYVKHAVNALIEAATTDVEPGTYNIVDEPDLEISKIYPVVYEAMYGQRLPIFLNWSVPSFFFRICEGFRFLAPLTSSFRVKTSRDEFRHLAKVPVRQSFVETAESVRSSGNFNKGLLV